MTKPSWIPRNEEQRQKQRLRAERAIRRGRAERAAHVLQGPGNDPLGVVALKGSSIDYFMEGLKDAVGRNHVLEVDAFGILQGAQLNERAAEFARLSIVTHARAYKRRGILAFMGFNFKKIDEETIPPLGEGIQSLLIAQHNSRRFRTMYPSVLLIGDGELSDLTSHPTLDEAQHPIARLVTRWALNETNELVTPTPGMETTGLPGLDETPGL